jgi:hypothetical protein
MSEGRKKPGVAFWATVVVVGGLAYPLSFGPACLIWGRHIYDWPRVLAVYEPCIRVVDGGPRAAERVLRLWTRCCFAEAALDEMLDQRRAEQHKKAVIAEYRRAILESEQEYAKQFEEARRKALER